MNAGTPSFTPGPWLSRRYAARRALAQKLLQERVRYEQQSRPTHKRDGRDRTDWDPFAVLFGVLMGSWFGRR
jgi:hypothetical protein